MKPTLTIILDADCLAFLADLDSDVEAYTAEAERLATEAGFGDVEIEEDPRTSGTAGVRVEDEPPVDPDDVSPRVYWRDLAETVRREAFEAVTP
jgi:hypothetical protein